MYLPKLKFFTIHKIESFNYPLATERILLKTFWEKGENAGEQDFFFHNAFCSSNDKFQFKRILKLL